MKKILNVLELYHPLKTNQEHFHIGLSILLGQVTLIKLNVIFLRVFLLSLVVTLTILISSFFIILYSLEWGAQRSNEWLITMMLSFGQSILVIDPLKVFIITAIISLLLRRPYNDEALDFDDPFTGALLANCNTNHIHDRHDISSDQNCRSKF